MSTRIPSITDQQRVALLVQREREEEWRRQRREYMADYRARDPEKYAKRVAKQSAKKRAERARASNRDLIQDILC
jgi:hypothetical protein